MSANVEGITSLTCSARTHKVDYEIIRSKTIKLIGHPAAIAWAYKFNIHGAKLKDDDFINVNGTQMSSADLIKRLATQEGWGEYEGRRASGTQKFGSKEIVTLSRLARAFASKTSLIIKKSIAPLSDDLKAIKAGDDTCTLADEFCFLNSPYGMSDETLKANKTELRKFFVQFDIVISRAVTNKYIKPTTTEKRNWAQDFDNYLAFRGL